MCVLRNFAKSFSVFKISYFVSTEYYISDIYIYLFEYYNKTKTELSL